MSSATKILVYNVKFLPTLARVFESPRFPGRYGFWEIGEKRRRDEERAALLAHQLTKAHHYDLIVLAEVFALHARRILKSELRRAGFQIVTCPITNPLVVTSGLLIASRRPVMDQSFFAFRHASGSDRFAKKGMLRVSLEGEREPLHLFATHLQAGDHAAAVRAAQLREARAFIDYELEGADDGRSAIMGDLNIIGEQEGKATSEYRSLRQTFAEFLDLHHLLRRGAPEPTWDPIENRPMIGPGYKEKERLDYVLVRGEEEEFTQERGASIGVERFILDGLALSDHYALSATLPF